MEGAELLTLLECNQPLVVEDIKKKFHENFNATKDPWILVGLVDYFIQTSSIRSVEIIVSVREPHDKYLFDRIAEGLKQSSKLQVLALLGHVVRRQPSWLYKITQHNLLKDILKLLKTETEILPLMSALLVLIILLPMIPTLIGPFLNDIFEVFSRLAAWNCNYLSTLAEEQLVHLQVGMYALFLRLYGMYPCNFLSYLRQEYALRDQLAVFSHTIKPMIDTVKLHPLLVTSTKDAEITNKRWKKMRHHDVVVECAKLTLDATERTREDSYGSLTSSFRSRSGTDYSNILDSSSYQLQQSMKNSTLISLGSGEKDFFSPTMYFQQSTSPPIQEISASSSIPQTPNTQTVGAQSFAVTSVYAHQEGTSPPEAAIEATPETTPIKDLRLTSAKSAPTNSTVVRALNTLNATRWPSGPSTPTQSQPSSPMKKEMSPFRFPPDMGQSAFEQPKKDFLLTEHRKDSITNQRINRLVHDRSLVNESPIVSDRSGLNLRSKTPQIHPTSPLRVISTSIPNSPVPIETTVPVPGGKEWPVAKPKPEKNGFRFESPVTQEDQEVLEIVQQGEQLRSNESIPVNQRGGAQHCDSVLQEFHPPHEEDFEECEQQQGSPCPSGGLHMPNSQSMRDFAKRVQRLRYYSHCVVDTTGTGTSEFSTGSSPGDRISLPESVKVRRANSCPEMKKGYTVLPVEPLSKDLNESDEINEGPVMTTSGKEIEENEFTNGPDIQKEIISTCTQTVDSWPLAYEHLFVGLFPSVEATADLKPSPAPSPAPCGSVDKTIVRFSPYEMLDKYIEIAVQGSDRDMRRGKVQGYESELKSLREQLELVHLQLQFERHRREVHSERNRRLLGKSKSNRALEEHNNALRDQLALLQKEIERLNDSLSVTEKDCAAKEKNLQDAVDYWKKQYISLQDQNKVLKYQKEIAEQNLKEKTEKVDTLLEDYKNSEALLFDLRNQMQFAINQALSGEQIQAELEHLQKELLMMGELQLKYQERFSHLSLLRCKDEEFALMTDTYVQEIKGMNQLLESRNSVIDSYKSRITDLESAVTKHDDICAEQKRMLKVVKEEYQEQLNAVESKYRTQRSVLKRMEEQMLELYTRIDRLEHASRRAVRSPDSQSSGRDIGSGNRTGLSPHSSPPLSVSLSSSEGGSMAFLQGASDVKEIKNLQVIVDESELNIITAKNSGSEDADKPSSSSSCQHPL